MNIDWRVIKRNLTNIATEREKKQYNRWISDDNRHKQYINAVKKYYDEGGSLDITNEFIDENYSKFEQQCLIAEKRRMHRKTIFKYVSAAAAVVIIFSATLATYLVSIDQKTQKNEVAINVESVVVKSEISTADILSVQLTTKSGKRFDIESNKDLKDEGAKAINIGSKNIDYSTIDDCENDEFHTISVPQGKNWQVSLSDGTVVYLNALSEITFPIKFNDGEERVVEFSGEGYFQVSHNPKMRFIVKTKDVAINVYGTKFNLNTNLKNQVEAVLIDGSLAIKPNNSSSERFIKPNEKATYIKADKAIEVSKVSALDYIAWIKNQFLFNRLELEQIMEQVSRWYNIEISYENESVKHEVIYLSAPRTESLDNILEAISKDERIHYRRKDDKVIIW